jgi:hypothetical protein
MQRQYHVLSDNFALTIENSAAGVLRLADNSRVAGAEQRVLHLLNDASQARLYHL